MIVENPKFLTVGQYVRTRRRELVDEHEVIEIFVTTSKNYFFRYIPANRCHPIEDLDVKGYEFEWIIGRIG